MTDLKVPKKWVDLLYNLFDEGAQVHEYLTLIAKKGLNINLRKDGDMIVITFLDPPLTVIPNLPYIPDPKRDIEKIEITRENVKFVFPNFLDPTIPVK